MKFKEVQSYTHVIDEDLVEVIITVTDLNREFHLKVQLCGLSPYTTVLDISKAAEELAKCSAFECPECEGFVDKLCKTCFNSGIIDVY
jgi:hypothetical protein